MKNLPNLGDEMDIQVQEADSQGRGTQEDSHQDIIIIKVAKFKRILNATKEKEPVTYKENPIYNQLIFLSRKPEGSGKIYTKG